MEGHDKFLQVYREREVVDVADDAILVLRVLWEDR